MQTFLPYSSYEDSARCLDNKRLGKQRVECVQILQCLLEGKKGWANHPVTKMWKGYEGSLYLYLLTINNEWRSRGFKSEKTEEHIDRFAKLYNVMLLATNHKPPFVGSENFHYQHRLRLLIKDDKFYSKYGWKVGK